MCGIVVVIGKGNIVNSLHKIKHRGLDFTKILNANNITIGFNRLAINDETSNGVQPFEFHDLIGVINGEIYNADELRKKFNIETKSNSDVEIILPLFKILGSSIIQYLDGFYSGIIYSKISRRIYLLRDYIGKKPLFFTKSLQTHFIVSELKAADNIIDFQIIPKGFSELRDNEISLIKQHTIPFIKKIQIKEILIEAVIKRIPKGEKQFGVFLSGGLDSSIIASIATKFTDNVIYYTLGNTDDLKFVELLSKKIGIESKIKKVALPAQNELPELIEKIVYHTESFNPSIISNGLATFLLSQAAHNDGLKVVLTGEGADELFCGYKVSYDAKEWFEKRGELIENMHFTECRRLDMSSMAHTIEVRCPFLDKHIYAISNDCIQNDLIRNNQGKYILREAFENDLPREIVYRDKMSFDVGSGIRKMIVEYLTKDGLTEKKSLKKIWSKYFQKSLSNNFYFHSYPTFDKAIAKRGSSHKTNQLEKIENLLFQEFANVPFHNIFMLNNENIVGTNLGGTCSDKALHFKKVLLENGIQSKLHSAYINEIECHRMLSVKINEQKYFIDSGSGWVNPKLIPAFKEIEYFTFGMSYKTELRDDNLFLFHKTDKDFKLMIRVPLKSKSENEIQTDIKNRFSSKIEYPFKNSLRFSKVIDGSFYFIKGDKLRIYNEDGIKEQILSKSEMKKIIQDTFKFDLQGMKNYYTPTINIVVIIATKNRVNLLKQRSLKSVYAQTLYPNRILITDDSDDQTNINYNITTIEEYKKQAPQVQIEHILNHRTKGAAGSWNSAVDLLLSQKQSPENTFIAILDDDDEWLADYLKLCFEDITKHSLDMIACDFYRIVESHKKINTAPLELSTNGFLIGNPGIQGSNLFIRLSCFLEAGCFDENIQSSTDRDLCIRITDLGNVKYKRLAVPLMKHFAESDRMRMSTPNTTIKNLGLYNFWLKYSKRMTTTQKENFLKRADKLFNWSLPKLIIEKQKKEFKELDNNESFNLFVGIICSDYEVISPLLTQLEQLQNENFIDEIHIFLLENNSSAKNKNNIFEDINSVKITFITKAMQDSWIETIDYFKNFSRNQNKIFSIAQARTLLQKYIGQKMKQTSNVIAWILDEDMQITKDTIQGLKVLPQLKNKGIDVVIGKYENSSPNPPINGIRVQLVDFWHNLNWLLNQKPTTTISDISQENNSLIKKYPDYYYDLSRKHSGHLEQPFWIKPNIKTETAGEAIKDLCKNVLQIFGGTPLTRPLVTIYSESLVDSAKDSVNRGGNTFVLNAEALESVPNLNIEINGTDIRRSDMMWAVINKHYRQMNIKAVNIPIWHAGKTIKNIDILDTDKVREEILGSCLYAGLTDFLKINPNHCLKFTDIEISEIIQNIENHLKQRIVLLKQSFYRARGIAKSIKNAEIYTQNDNLHKLTRAIDNFFSQQNFDLIEKNVANVSFATLSKYLKLIQKQSDNYKDSKL